MTRCAKCKQTDQQTPLFQAAREWFCAKCAVVLVHDGRVKKEAA